MIPTLEFVKERFDYFNSILFTPALPPIPIKIGSAGRALGSFRYPRRYPASKPRGVGECTITISRTYDRPKEDIEDVIIHEMIHYLVWLNRVDEPAHGPEFRKFMNLINTHFNRNVTVRDTLSDEELSSDSRISLRVVVAARLNDGSFGVACVARTCLAKVKKALDMNNQPHTWYVSTDPFFNRYPIVRTPKLFRISESDYKAHVLTATVIK